MSNENITLPDSERDLKPKEAAQLLGVSTYTLREWRSNGDGPPFRAYSSKTVRYNLDELNAWRRSMSSKVDPQGVRIRIGADA